VTFDQDALDACVHCGLCLTSCPTYDVTRLEQHGPRGRIEGMRAVHRGEISPLDPDYVESMQTCVQCRACELVCPSAVPFGQLMESARADFAQADTQWRRHERRSQEEDPSSAASATEPSAVVGERLGRLMLLLVRHPLLLHVVTLVLQVVQRVGLERCLPSAARVGRPVRPARRGGADRIGSDVVHLYRGCVMDRWFGDVQEASRRVLSTAGYEVATRRRGPSATRSRGRPKDGGGARGGPRGSSPGPRSSSPVRSCIRWPGLRPLEPVSRSSSLLLHRLTDRVGQ
jgi:glycolate oxidase iron-sulfur subunit